jgi:glycosyltransferase involved in cell wall biosynthesis
VRVGIDARELLGRSTGAGRYLAELLAEWGRLPGARAHEFVLYVPAGNREGVGKRLADPARFEVREVAGAGGTLWEQSRLPNALRRDDLDVFFAPAYTAPLMLTAPLVLTVHDVSFAAHPEWFRWREGVRRRWLTAALARRARAVLTDTEFSRQEIRRWLRVPAERIRVIPLGVRRSESGATAREPLVLYAGSIFNRRNLPLLIAAFAEVARTHSQARLVVAGENRTHPPVDLAALVQAYGLGRAVALERYVAEEQLASLYRRARVFVFLSEYEGFGLTPLEALAAGVPIVLLDTPVAREVYGPAAVYVAHGDVEGLSRVIRELLTSEPDVRGVPPEADQVLARYSWHATARETLKVLEAAAP